MYKKMKVRTVTGGIFFIFLIVTVIGLIVPLAYCSNIEIANDESTNCYGIVNCSECTTCIRDYVELESDILRSAFFSTGQVPSSFVRINYDFHASDLSNVIDNITENSSNCYHHQELYFWSSSSLLLFGPQPLLYLTMFAVNVPEQAVTIPLPYLCKDTYSSPLSELTYQVNITKYLYMCIILIIQVKTYAVHGQPQCSQFNSQFFIHAKIKHMDKYEGSDKYNCIATILKISAFNPPLLAVAVLILAYYYIYPKSLSFVRWLSYDNHYVNNVSTNTGWVLELYTHLIRIKKTFIPALIIFSIGLNAVLFLIYVLSVVKLFEYGKELFCSDDCVVDAEKCDYCIATSLYHVQVPFLLLYHCLQFTLYHL